MNWYVGVLRKYAVFKGRAQRKEFWMFLLFHLIIGFLLACIQKLSVGVAPGDQSLLANLYLLATIPPFLAVTIRRLHDVGFRGWWVLATFVPVVGIGFFVLMVLDGQPRENKYGPNPKEAETGGATVRTEDPHKDGKRIGVGLLVMGLLGIINGLIVGGIYIFNVAFVLFCLFGLGYLLRIALLESQPSKQTPPPGKPSQPGGG